MTLCNVAYVYFIMLPSVMKVQGCVLVFPCPSFPALYYLAKQYFLFCVCFQSIKILRKAS